MATSFLRVIKYGFQTFFRNGTVSLAALLVMVWALLVFEGLLLLGVATREAVTTVQDKIDISVYFKTNVPEDAILKIERALEELPEVKAVEYISRDRALELFRERHSDPDSPVLRALEELDANPLQASLNIKANDPDQFGDIAAYFETPDIAESVERVSYSQVRLAIERLSKIVRVVEGFALALTIFLAFTAALVTFNTISLALYSNREEIAIMRLVGASNFFINGPYIFVGFLYGFIATFITIILTLPFLGTLSRYFGVLIPEFNLRSYFFGNILLLGGYELLFGVALSVISSVIAIRRYLKI